MSSTSPRTQLASSLRRRTPTWEVARLILELEIDGLPRGLRRDLSQLAGGARWSYEVFDDFDLVDPADSQLATFAELFAEIETSDVDASDPNAIRGLVVAALRSLGIVDHLSAEAALAAFATLEAPAGVGRARMRKRLRFLRRLEQKAARVEDTTRLRYAQMQAKSRLAYRIDADACDDVSLAFCAYLAARANRRSIFQLGPQSRAQDSISDGLERLLKQAPAAAWGQIALVKPTPAVIGQLPPDERGKLVGMFHAALADAASALGELYAQLPERMRREMVMIKGVDSSRWNAYAGALNTMRSAWISAMIAAGLEGTFDSYLPGKAPRLMASDLVWWARESGQDLHEDTQLFAVLPHPWQVISGVASQGRDAILAAAAHVGLSPSVHESGWIGPRTAVELERPAAEPALVHGVVVGDPKLAATLRRCGVFSAKQVRDVEHLPQALTRGEVRDGRRVTHR